MRPVGEVEHRENLLDFVNWATRGSSAQTPRGSTAERAMKSTSSCESPSCSKSGQAKDTSSMESNQTILGGELGSSGETESQEKTQVNFCFSYYMTCVYNLMITRCMFRSGLQTQMQT